MAMSGGGYGGYGGPDDYYQQDANGNHNHGGGGHHALSNGVGGDGGGSGMEHEQDDPEESLRLHERIKEVDVECCRRHAAANDTQTLLEDREIARLATEMEVKELKAQHEEKLRIYRDKARKIHEQCSVGDNRIKELQDGQKKLDEEMKDARLYLREMIVKAKSQEREAVLNEERRKDASASGSYSCEGANGGTASPGAESPAASYAHSGKSANGGGMGRRTQPSTGDPFAPRKTSTGAGAGAGAEAGAAAPGERGKRPQGKSSRSGAHPKPVDQMRQAFMEDTLTNFYGL
eukprot:g12243.t1